MKKLIITLLLSVFFISGCATTDNWDKQVDAYQNCLDNSTSREGQLECEYIHMRNH